MGFAFDGWWLPKDTIQQLFKDVKRKGIKITTTHYAQNAIQSFNSLPAMLESYGILDERMLLSHCNGMTKEDAELFHKRNAHISSTPSTEMQTGIGVPVCLDDKVPIQDLCSLGVDCHSNNAGSIVSEMRLALQSARGRNNEV